MKRMIQQHPALFMALLVALVIVLLSFGCAYAFDYPMVPYQNGHDPMVTGGPNGPMVPNVFDLTPPPPNPCTGAADFSDGCAVAVFH